MIKISKTSKTSESFYHFCKYEPKNPISNPKSFKFKLRILHSTNNITHRCRNSSNRERNTEVINFLRTLRML